MSRHGKHAAHQAHHDPARRSRRRQVIALVLVAALGLGWLAWNLLLVESDVAGVADEVQQDAQQAPAASAP